MARCCSALPGSHAIQILRRARKRQPRRAGATCKGRAVVCNHVAAHKLLPQAEPEEVCPVELQSGFCAVVASDSDVSTANEAVEADSNQCEVNAQNTALQRDVGDGSDLCELYAGSRQDAHSVVALEPDIKAHLPKETTAKIVQFDLEATSIHLIPPYAEIYGAHPRSFVFDWDSTMIPAARGGFNSAAYVRDAPEEKPAEEGLDLDFRAIQQDSGDDGWESWLEQTADDESEFARRTSLELAQRAGSSDLDHEDGWEAWVESTLNHTQRLFEDTP